MVIGIIGCGDICHTYIREIKRLYSDTLYIKTVANRTMAKAEEMAVKYGIENYQTIEEILEDPEIEMIVNLTIPKVHHEINKKILKAGKHVFCEKPLAFTMEEIEELEKLAEEKNLSIGSAPDTFLSAPVQSCKKILEDGWIGKVHSVTANMMHPGCENWHPSPEFYYQEGAGPLWDMGGYYLTVLIELFGKIAEVYAYDGKAFEKRTIHSQPLAGKVFDVEVPTQYHILMKTENGIIIDFTLSFDVWYTSKPKIEVYGTEGTLIVPDPNLSDGVPKVYRKEQRLRANYGLQEIPEPYELPLLHQSVCEYVRGTGVADLAVSIQNHTEHRTNLGLVKHVTKIMLGIMESARTGERVTI